MAPKKGLIFRILLVLLFVSIVINLLSFQNGHNWGDDFAGYLKQAQVLSKGNFADLKVNMTQMDNILNYPWGYPMLLSPFIHLLDFHLNLLKLYTYLFFILSLLFIFLLLRKDRTMALMTLLLLSSSPYFWEFKENLLADYPNLCFTYLSLYLMREVIQGQKIILNELLSHFLIGFSVFVSFSMRNQSIVLLPVLLILQLFVYGRKALRPAVLIKLILPYITFFALALVLSWLIPISSTAYAEQYNFSLLFILKTIGNNVVYYLKVWNELFDSTSLIAHFSGIFSGFAICLAVIGVAGSIRKENILLLVFPLICICLFLITPFYQGLRYAMPIVPLFVFFFLKGAHYLSMKISRARGPYAYLCLGIFLVLLSLKSIVAGAYVNYRTSRIMKGPYEPDCQELFRYIEKNTSPADRIEFWKPRVILLYTGRNSIFTPTRELYLNKGLKYMVYYKYPDILNDQIPLDTVYMHKDELSPCFSNNSYLMFKTREPAK
ncbi:MAG: hypothetical protein Q8932_05620 [Bacteroidota bacterium]|nr:hypothetical protein [Bacteroidota bacterium]